MLAMLGNVALDVFGGLAMATLVAIGARRVFELVGIPELGPWVAFGVIVTIPGAIHRSFVQMLVFFLGIAAVVLLGEGKSWRERERVRRRLNVIAGGYAKPIGGQGSELPPPFANDVRR